MKNKTATALTFCRLLPTTVLKVARETIQLRCPFITEDATEIHMMDYNELVTVCKWLRAIKERKLVKGSGHYVSQFDPVGDAAITSGACYDILLDTCCKAGGPSPNPSWSIFRMFVMFIHNLLGNLQVTVGLYHFTSRILSS